MSVQMDGIKVNAPRYPTLFLEQIPHSTFIECNYTRAQEFFKVQKYESLSNTCVNMADIVAIYKVTMSGADAEFCKRARPIDGCVACMVLI